MVNRPDYVVFVPRQPRDPKLRDPKKPGDTYNDHFQVIEDEKRGLLYAFWTQASREGAFDQHIAFSKSADRGRSWTAPVIRAGSPNKSNPGLLASWQQPMLGKTGRLYCLWNLSITNSKVQSFGACWGAYSDNAGETWSRPQSTPLKQMAYDAIAGAPDWINWQRPLRLGQDGRFLVGCSRTGKAPWAAVSHCGDFHADRRTARLVQGSKALRAARRRQLLLHEFSRAGRQGRAVVQ